MTARVLSMPSAMQERDTYHQSKSARFVSSLSGFFYVSADLSAWIPLYKAIYTLFDCILTVYLQLGSNYTFGVKRVSNYNVCWECHMTTILVENRHPVPKKLIRNLTKVTKGHYWTKTVK